MTYEELLRATSTGKLPKVRYGDRIGQVVTIKDNRSYKGCAVDFGEKYDEWFHDAPTSTTDKRSKYLYQLELAEEGGEG